MGSPPFDSRVAKDARRSSLLEPLTKACSFYITLTDMSKADNSFWLLRKRSHKKRHCTCILYTWKDRPLGHKPYKLWCNSTFVERYFNHNCESQDDRPSEMIERRQHRRVEVDFWASLEHPLPGTVTGDIQDMSVSGLSLTLDEEMNFFCDGGVGCANSRRRLGWLNACATCASCKSSKSWNCNQVPW